MKLEKVYDELYGMIEDLKKQIATISGGDDVTITPALESGTKVADYTIGEESGSLYAPDQSLPYVLSKTPQKVGTWIDGSDVYRVVHEFDNDLSVSYDSFTSTGIDATNVSVMLSAKGIYSSGATAYNLIVNKDNNLVRLQTDRNGAGASIKYLILEYVETPPTETKNRRKK